MRKKYDFTMFGRFLGENLIDKMITWKTIKNNKHLVTHKNETETYLGCVGKQELIIQTNGRTEEEMDELEMPYILFESTDNSEFTLNAGGKNPRKIWSGTASSKMEYSIDNDNDWKEWQGEYITGKKIYLRGTGNYKVYDANDYNLKTDLTNVGFRINADNPVVKCYGNLNALLNYQSVIDSKNPPNLHHTFCGLFANQSALIKAPAIMPEKNLSTGCFAGMYKNCINLQEVPSILPATELPNYCYYEMFLGCTNLKSAPKLPALIVPDYGYCSMFEKSGLETAPELPAMEVKGSAYSYMFKECKSLTKAPALPATTISGGCVYYQMFYNCTSLKTPPPELPAENKIGNNYSQMFYNCSKLTGTIRMPQSVKGTAGDIKGLPSNVMVMYTL